jgi:hypothetical protein
VTGKARHTAATWQDARGEHAIRRCLKCGRQFKSEHRGNRRCKGCAAIVANSTPVREDGVWAETIYFNAGAPSKAGEMYSDV